jgi:hypothetical protein
MLNFRNVKNFYEILKPHISSFTEPAGSARFNQADHCQRPEDLSDLVLIDPTTIKADFELYSKGFCLASYHFYKPRRETISAEMNNIKLGWRGWQNLRDGSLGENGLPLYDMPNFELKMITTTDIENRLERGAAEYTSSREGWIKNVKKHNDSKKAAAEVVVHEEVLNKSL